MLDDIESNIVGTEGATNQGVKELTKASRLQRSTRNKVICDILIFVVDTNM